MLFGRILLSSTGLKCARQMTGRRLVIAWFEALEVLPYFYINTHSYRIKKLCYECISEIPILHMLLMGGWVVLGEIIGQVSGSFSPVDD